MTATNGQPIGALLRELDGTTFIVIDFEGLTPAGRPPEPVEVAAIALACRGGQLPKACRFTELMRPPANEPVTGEFTRITAITAGMLSGARPACEVMADLEKRLMVPARGPGKADAQNGHVKPLRRGHVQAGEAGEALLCGSLRPPGLRRRPGTLGRVGA